MAMMAVSDAVCRGSWALGSACGKCTRCHETLAEAPDVIRTLLRRIEKETPKRSEWSMLADSLRAAERKAAEDRDYDYAKDLKHRIADIDEIIKP